MQRRPMKPQKCKVMLKFIRKLPSYFWHNTVPFVSDDDRICIAFDVLPLRSAKIPA